MTRLTPDLCIIGAGAAGLSLAAGAVQMGAAVVLVERGRMGGDCLNYGCVPSKALLAAAKAAHAVAEVGRFGLRARLESLDDARVYERIRKVIAGIAPHDSEERFRALGVTVIRAEARFLDPRTIAAGDAVIAPRRIVLATGSRPAIPPIPGLDSVPYLTNETIFDRDRLPAHLIVLGGGPIGVEMAQAHRRLGCRVTLVEQAVILPQDDPELVAVLRDALRAEGADLREGVSAIRVEPHAAGVALQLADGAMVAGSDLLVATGRAATAEGLDLDRGGIAHDAGGIAVDARLRSTTNRRVWAIGDAAGQGQFTHLAGHHAGIAIRNLLFRLPARGRPPALPWVTYAGPELAQVGPTEHLARESGQPIRVLSWPFAETDRARAEGDTAGLVKAVVARSGRILGCGIVGTNAGELIQPWTLAIEQGLPVKALAATLAPYPTRGEASKRAAGRFYADRLFSPMTRRVVGLLRLFG